MAGKTVEEAVSNFGASVKPKLSHVAISGAPEDLMCDMNSPRQRDLFQDD